MNADPTRLEQVVVNLLNNAAKYSENAGHIDLSPVTTAMTWSSSSGTEAWAFRPRSFPGMFELFAQGDRSLARSEGGLGIGLTVVKKLVEMHDGSVSVKSEGVGKGSEFTIRLRRGASAKPCQKRKRAAAPGPANRKARILVVDDNVDTAHGMARLLRLIGHEVAMARMARSHPVGSGVSAGIRPPRYRPARHGRLRSRLPLRQEECCKDAVFMAISGYGQEQDRRRSKEAGFDYHLIKPLDHDALLSVLSAGASSQR